MPLPIRQLRGMTEDAAERLKYMGITNTDQFLAAARTPEDRRELAQRLNVDEKTVLEWANRADLARIRGIGGVYGDLLEHAGVDTVAELAQRDPQKLYKKLVEINVELRLARRLPRPEEVARWVEEAKKLGRGLEY